MLHTSSTAAQLFQMRDCIMWTAVVLCYFPLLTHFVLPEQLVRVLIKSRHRLRADCNANDGSLRRQRHYMSRDIYEICNYRLNNKHFITWNPSCLRRGSFKWKHSALISCLSLADFSLQTSTIKGLERRKKSLNCDRKKTVKESCSLNNQRGPSEA